MRKLIVSNIMSLDARHTGPGDDVMALPMDAAFDSYNAERLRAADTLLLGRASYELLKGFWPSVADDATASPTEREVAKLNNEIDKVVISDSLTAEETEPWLNTRIIGRADAHREIAELKRGDGEEILVFGSHTLWNDLLANDLVDELHLMIGAVILGSGTPALVGDPSVSLQLIDTRTWEDSGNVLVRYAVRDR
jgi:dihydrofolate reductase